jgi:hypothetical protein
VAWLAARTTLAPPTTTNDLDLAADQVGRQFGEAFFGPLRIARLKDEVLPLHLAQFTQAFAEGFEAGRDRDHGL